MASIDWTAPGNSIKGNTKAFRKLKGTGRILAKSFESKNLEVIIKKSNHKYGQDIIDFIQASLLDVIKRVLLHFTLSQGIKVGQGE